MTSALLDVSKVERAARRAIADRVERNIYTGQYRPIWVLLHDLAKLAAAARDSGQTTMVVDLDLFANISASYKLPGETAPSVSEAVPVKVDAQAEASVDDEGDNWKTA